MKKRFYSHGKLLLSGEYAVLDGALALAVPTRQGQWLEVSPTHIPGLSWTSLDVHGQPWLQATFTREQLEAPVGAGPFPAGAADRLLRLLQTAMALQPAFRETCLGIQVVTGLEFPQAWGLGSSSTLIANLAAWAGANPYALLEATLGGSGYDLACATATGPIFYQRDNQGNPNVTAAPFAPVFAEALSFIYLNEKQDSREGIRRYREAGGMDPDGLVGISALSRKMAGAATLGEFREAMEAHEALISQTLGMPTIQAQRFPDFDGSLKSLGAWGGDFFLCAGGTQAREYFASKGYTTQIPYNSMVLS